DHPFTRARPEQAFDEHHEHHRQDEHQRDRDHVVRDQLATAREVLARELRVSRPPDRRVLRLYDRIERDEPRNDHAGEDRREDRDALADLVREPVADTRPVAVDVRDHRHEREPDRWNDDTGETLIHVQEELLQVQEVPRCLRRIGGAVDRRVVLQRRVEQRRDHEETERPDHRRDELDDQQMWPDHRRVFDALVDTDDRVLTDECEKPELLLLPRERLWSARSGHSLTSPRASSTSRRTPRSRLATPARHSTRALRSGRLGADARSGPAAPYSLAPAVMLLIAGR